ncbi:MAG TPA: hypothetical protein VE344_03755 [Methylomirabilota bacterium]|nr:hypothetical protein [Methylomirabilota bacterium]
MPPGTNVITILLMDTNGEVTAGALWNVVYDTTVPAPVINSIGLNTNNGVTLFCSGGAGLTYFMQAATNLSASPIPWLTISTNVADANGLWQFMDSLTNGVYSFWQTNLVYAISSTTNTDVGTIVYYSTNVIGTNVALITGDTRFYRASSAP